MKRVFLFSSKNIKLNLLLLFLISIFISAAKGHPLGNFTVNQFSQIEVDNSQIKIKQILDLAEIPTFQQSAEIDVDKDGSLSQIELNSYAEKITPNYIAQLSLSVNDKLVLLQPESTEIIVSEGEGKLPIIKIIWNVIGKLPNSETVNLVNFENKNNNERLGWNEIFVTGKSSVNIFDSSVYGSSLTDELKNYPSESLSAPLVERTAKFSYSFGNLPPTAKTLQTRDGANVTSVQKDKFAELINVPEITLPIVLLGLALAFGFGALHAMSPGHGKTVVGAYLVGSRGTIKHAIFLGLTVTITHTVGVFALGFITLFASSYILPERMMPMLNFVSGLLVLFIGLSLFKERLFSYLDWKIETHHHQPHSTETDSHPHTHDGVTHTHGGSTHSHLPPQEVSWRNLLALGVSGGLIPCPSAIILMLSAISAGRIGYGLILTLFFSLGLAATLTGIGLLFLNVGKLFDSSSIAGNRIFKTIPVFSAFLIACIGAVICYSSFS